MAETASKPRRSRASKKGGVESETIDFTISRYPAATFAHDELDLSADDLREMYRSMALQRRFEERAAQMYGKQKIAGFLHLYIGQEAVSTGTVNALNVGHDSVITAYRDHGIGLALGMTPDESMAELFGRAGGSSKGKGGSMHYFKKEVGMYGGHGIVGAHVPVGIGIAFAHQYKEDGGVCVIFLGDGAVGQGAVHEALNLASLYKLPAIVVIENNNYAMGTSTARAFGQPEFSRLSVGYDLPASVVDGMDVLTVTKAMRDHVQMARDGKPSLIEMKTYRYRGHSMSDPQNYRTKEEMDAKKEDDPIIRLKAYMVNRKLATADELDAIDDEVKEVVLDAVEFADGSPLPEIEAAYEDVYAQKDYPFLA
jgi:pyruvate dehydrogenase E1 component alpha subunit